MQKWFTTSIAEVRKIASAEFEQRVLGHLSLALSYRAITDEQRSAWRSTAAHLWAWVQGLRASDRWLAIMEYAPPLLTSRSDLLIVTEEHVLVIEIVGSQKVGTPV